MPIMTKEKYLDATTRAACTELALAQAAKRKRWLAPLLAQYSVDELVERLGGMVIQPVWQGNRR